MNTGQNTFKISSNQYYTGKKKIPSEIHHCSIVNTSLLLKRAHQNNCNATVKCYIITTKELIYFN